MILMGKDFKFIAHVATLEDVADNFLHEGYLFDSVKVYPPLSADDGGMNPVYLRAIRASASELGIHGEEEETPFFVGYLSTLPMPNTYWIKKNKI